MEQETYQSLKSRLDAEIIRLESSLPNPQPEASPHAKGVALYPGMDMSKVPKEQLPLVHVMLHNFFANHSGRGLRQKDIEQLHKEVVQRLDSHPRFDQLDDTV